MASSKKPAKHAPDYGQLEDRVMLSAAPLPGVEAAGDQPEADNPQESGQVAFDSDITNSHDNSNDTAAQNSSNGEEGFRFESQEDIVELRRELVIIDESATNYQQLVDDLLSRESDSRKFEIHAISSDRDGITQISEILAQTGELDALHIVSHGTGGAVKLGNTWLTADNISADAGQIAGWQDSLTLEADLLLYGCDLASNEDGRTLLESLGALCDCDIAASDDLTGHSTLGGDWDLEYRRGEFETGVAFSQSLQANWEGVLATYTVTNTNDSGAGSLRQAILDANANAGADTIEFNISGGGVHRIRPDSALPTITESVVIDASTQPGYTDGNPVIELRGDNAGASTNGFTINADDVTIRGFIIHDFLDDGIEISGANNIIVGNWIGLDENGDISANGDDGIDIKSAGNNNTIGGTTPADRNVISGNGDFGITINGGDDNDIIGNYIGTNKDGNAAQANAGGGIYLYNGATGNTIGGVGNERNIISGNSGDAVRLRDATTTLNVFQGNYIGVDVTGNTGLANNGDGINIGGGAHTNTIGGDRTAGAGNVISGNTGTNNDGIEIDNAGANNNVIYGNFIGTNYDGTTAIANGRHGVVIYNGVQGTKIGGSGTGQGNIISGNTEFGVVIDGNGLATTSGNLIQSNTIGLKENETETLGNGSGGIHIFGNAQSNTIGGGVSEVANVIGGNKGAGILLNNASNHTIQGNYIGTDRTGLLNLGNSSGVEFSGGAANNLIGGTESGQRNIIAFNSTDGLRLLSDAGSGNASLGNIFYQHGSSTADLGIDNNADGINSNDSGDGDTGPNDLQNSPVLTSAVSNKTGTTVVGSLNSNANTTYRIEFYSNRPSIADPTHGEGERYLGFITVTTNGSGDASFNTTITDVWVNSGDKVTATATVDLGSGNYGSTSEFAANVTATSAGVIVVDTTADTNDGTTTSIANLGNNRGADNRISLREAIIAANNTSNSGGPDKIVFAIPESDANYDSATNSWRIQPTGSALPFISDALTIDGTTQAGYDGTPSIDIDGSLLAAANTHGFESDNGGITLSGLVIRNFTGYGVYFSDGTDNTVLASYIGSDVTGTTAQANLAGIVFEGGADDSVVGGQYAGEGNLIAFNTEDGVRIDGPGGVAILGNAIRSNGQLGIDLVGGTEDVNGVTANDPMGTNDEPDQDNGSNGLQNTPVLATSHTTSAGTTITGFLETNASTTYRIEFFANDASVADATNGEGQRYLGSTTVTTNAGGIAAINVVLNDAWVNNGEIVSATATVDLGGGYFGSTSEFSNNITATADGIIYVDTTSDEADGDTSSIAALYAERGADGKISLREAIAAANNSANGASADKIYFNLTTGDTNYIDPDATPGNGDEYWKISPGSFLGYITDEVYLDATTQSGYVDQPVIEIDGTAATDATAIFVLRSDNSLIRGFALHSSADEGIEIDGSTGAGDSNTIQGNWVGVTAEGNADANTEVGILITADASDNIIGGSGANQGNVIASSGLSGIHIRNLGSNRNIVQGNLIGVLPDGTTNAANLYNGIEISDAAANNLIGGSNPGEGNIIAHSGNAGVFFATDAGVGNTVVRNAIYSNGKLGIDIDGGTEDFNNVTANDFGDGDSGANDLLNTPILRLAESEGSTLTLAGFLNVDGANSDYRIDFYGIAAADADGSGHGEGPTWLGFANVQTDPNGDAVFSDVVLTGVTLGQGDYITATATQIEDINEVGTDDVAAFGSTSEFAANREIATDNYDVVNSVPVGQNTNEDTPLVFNSANGNLISITDNTGEELRVTVSVTQGTLTLSGTNGLSFVAGNGTDDATMTFTGSLEDINTALNGLTYTPALNYNGGDTLTVFAADNTVFQLDIDANLQGRYQFESGTETDDTGTNGAQSGVLNGATVVVDGDRGSVLSLDGNGDYFDIPGELFSAEPNITLAAWVKYSSADTQGGEIISLGNNIILRVDDFNEGVTGIFYDGSAWQYIGSGVSLADNKWHHVAFSFDDTNNTQSLYIDGVLVATENHTSSIVYTQGTNTRIGANAGSSNDQDFNGLIDDVRIYDRVLTADEVSSLSIENAADTDTVAITVAAVNDASEFSTGYESFEADFGGSNSFTQTGKATIFSDNRIVIDPTATYDLSALAFSGDGMGGNYNAGETHYLGFASYDIDGNLIQSHHVGRVTGSTDTTLAVELKAGDTQIVLSDATGWHDGGTSSFRSLAWYDYADSYGNEYADYTYTRNVSFDLWDAGSISGNVIMLRTAWAGPTIAAGKAVRNAGSGGTYQYALHSNGAIGTTETEFTATIGGGYETTGAYSPTLFRYGTHEIGALVLANYTATSNQLNVSDFTIEGSSATAGYIEGGSATSIIDDDVSLTDVDDAYTESFIVTLTNGKVGDLITVNETKINELGISITGVPAGALSSDGPVVLTLSSMSIETVTHSDYQNALSYISFSSTSDNPDTTDRQFTFVSNDGDDASTPETMNMRVTAANDAPVITTLAPNITYTEDGQPVQIDPTGTITDADSADFDGGTYTVTITGNGTANDILQIRDQGTDPGEIGVSGANVTYGGTMFGTFSGGAGDSDPLIVLLNANATPPALQALHRNVQFRNTTEAPSELDREITFELTDGDNGTATPATKTLHVQAVNDAPTISNSGGSPTYFENGGAVVLDNDLDLADAELDAANDYSGASITVIRDGGANNNDRFGFSDGNGITLVGDTLVKNGQSIASFVTSTTSGTLVVTFTNANGETPTSADVDNIARQITYAHASDSPPTSVQIDFTLNDGNSGAQGSGGLMTRTVTKTVNITASNDAPVAADDRLALSFDGVDDYVNIGDTTDYEFTDNFTLELAFRLEELPETQELLINREGEYEIGIFSDGTIRWAFSNSDPGWAWYDTGHVVKVGVWTHVAVSYEGGVVKTYVDGTLVDTYNGSGTIGDAHSDDDDLRIGGRQSNPTGQYFKGEIADVRIWDDVRTQSEIDTNKSVELDPTMEGNLVGYWLFDENTGTAARDRTSNENHGDLGGGVVSQQPAWSGHRIDEDGVLNVAAPGVLGNDYDAEGDSLTAVLDSGPSNASSFTFNADGSFDYTPNADFVGVDSFTYHVNDGTTDSNTATVYITVDPINDAPVRTAGTVQNLMIAEDAGLTSFGLGSVAYSNGGGADENGQSLTYQVTVIPSSSFGDIFLADGTTRVTLGSYSLTQIRGMQFRSAPNASGTSFFTYRVIDDGGTANGGNDTLNESIQIDVSAVDDAPNAYDDGPSSSDLILNDASTVAFYRLNESSGATAADSVNNNDGTYTDPGYSAAGATNDNDSAIDFNGSSSRVNLGGLDVGGTGITLSAWVNADSFAEDEGRIISKAVTGAQNTHTWMLSTDTVNSEIRLRFRLKAGGVTDELQATSGELSTGQWHHTAATYDAATGQMRIYLNGTLVGSATHSVGGAVDVEPSTDAWIGANPNSDKYFDGRIDEVAILERSLSADEINSIHVDASGGYKVNEDTPLSVSAANGVLRNDTDVEGDSLTVQLVTGPSNALSFTLNADGSFDYTGAANFNGTDSFVYRTYDGNSYSSNATAYIEVSPVNDAPTAANNTVTTNEDVAYTFTAADFNFADVDGDPLASVQITSLESAGALQLSGSDVTLNQIITKADIDAGNLKFVPVGDANGTGYDSFGFSVNDGTVDSASTYTMTVDVTPQNDAPTAANNTVTTNEDVTYTFTAADFNFADIDGDTLASVQITSLESAGELQLSGSDVTLNQVITKADIDAGNLKFVPVGDANGMPYDNFGFSVNDGTIDSASTYTMTVDVTPQNDAPTAANNTVSTDEDVAYTFTSANFNFADIDGDTLASVRITSLESAGALQLSGSDVTLNQVITKADIDAGNLRFVPVGDANGTGYDSFGFSVNDGTVDSASTYTMTVDVQAVNDAPINTFPATASTNEDTTLNFTGGNQIQISDVDHNNMDLEVSLSVNTGGLLTLGDATGLSFTVGNGTDDASMTFTGSLADINAALATLRFEPTANFNGGVNLTIVTNDQGNTGKDPGATGDGSSEQDTDVVAITVHAVNDAPEIDLDANNSSGAGGSEYVTVFTEDGGTVLLADVVDATITDVDLENLASLTVTLVNPIDSVSESLTADTTGTSIVANYDSGTGVLSLTGSDSVANYQQVLRTVAYNNTSQNPDTTARVITFVANDGTTNSEEVTWGDPGAQGLVGYWNFNEGAGNQAFDLSGNGNHGDLTNMNPATDWVEGNAGTGLQFDGVDDFVEVPYSNEIKPNGDFTLSLWIQPGSVTSGTRRVAEYGKGQWGSDGWLINQYGDDLFWYHQSNGPTSVANNVFSVGQWTHVAITRSGDTFTLFVNGVQMDQDTKTGSITGNHSLYFGSDAGSQQFDGALDDFRIYDNALSVGQIQSVQNDRGAVATVSIQAVNDAPVNSYPANVSTNEDTTLNFTGANQIQISDADDQGGDLQVSLSVNTGGLLTLGDTTGLSFTTGNGTDDPGMTFTGSLADINAALTTLSFEPTENFNGAVNLTITTNDQGNTGNDPGATGDGSSEQDSDVVAITVNPVNDAPTAANNTVTTNEDVTYTFTASDFNFADIDGDSLASIQITSLESAGALQLNGSDVTLNQVITKADIDSGNLKFVPVGDANGMPYDNFGFSVNDGTVDSASTYTMTVDVTPQNDAPTAANNAVTTNEDVTYTFTAADFNFADIDGDTLASVQITSLESVGALQLSGSDVTLNQVVTKADIDAGNLRFVPVANANGTNYDNFGFSVNDGTIDSVSTYTVTVDVTPQNDAPTAANNTVTTNEDVTYTFAASDFNFADIDGDSLASVQITSLESAGALQISGSDVTLNQVISKADIDAGNLTFVPVSNADGTNYDNFGFSVNDGTTDSASTYTMTVDVTPQNDAPTAANNTVTTNEDVTYTFAAADFNFADIDGDTLASVQITSLESAGALQLSGSDVMLNQVISKADIDAGNLRFVPVGDANGMPYDNFTFLVNDGTVNSVSTYTMTVDVTPQNDVPTAANNTVTTNEDVTYTFTAADFNFADIDGDALASVQITSLESAGALQLSGSDVTLNQVITKADIDAGNLTFVPISNANGTNYDNFGFSVNDGTIDSASTYTMTVDVTPQNDAPTAANNTVTTNEDVNYTFTAADFNFADIDGDTLASVQITSLESAGALQLNGSDVTLNLVITKADIDAGNLRFVPVGDANGMPYDSFEFSVNDGTVDSASTYTMTVDVTAVNDAPLVATNAGATYVEGSTGNIITMTMLNEGDVDDSGTGLTYTITSNPALTNGTLFNNGVALNSGDSFTQADIDANRIIYNHDGSNTTSDSFGFSLADGGEDGAMAVTGQTFSITITAVDDDAPTEVVNNDSTVAEGGTDTIARAELEYTDTEQNAANVNYTVTGGLANGQLELTTNAGVAITTFTQDDINNNRVVYVHDHSNTTDGSFSFTVDDSHGNQVLGQTFTINVTPIDDDAPTEVVNNGSTVAEGGTDTIARAELEYTDTEQSAVNVNYTVTGGPANGQLELTTNSGVAITTFTQDDINNNRVVFSHDGSNTTDGSFSFNVDDGQGNQVLGQTFTINVSAVNDAPVLTSSGSNPTFTEDGPAVVLDGSIDLADSELDELNGGDGNYNGATVSLVRNTGANSDDVFGFLGDATYSLSGGNILKSGQVIASFDTSSPGRSLITFTDSFTTPDSKDANSVLQQITYSNPNQNPSGPITIDWIFNDQNMGSQGSGGARTSSASTVVNITPVNDAPIITSNGGGDSAGVSINENSTAVTTVTSTDVDNASATYSISGADATLFDIDAMTGVLTFKTAPDFESPGDADMNNQYEVRVTAADGSSGFDHQDITVTVLDLNDNPPVITPGQTFAVNENSANGTVVGNALASDVDTVGMIQNWMILGGNADGNFAIDPSSGQITVTDNTNLNFEATPVYTLTLQVSDGVNTSATQTVQINIGDVNEDPVITSTASPNHPENSTDVLTVISSDVDTTPQTFTYAITGGNDQALFAIDPNTGLLSFNTAPDFENPTDVGGDNMYEVEVTVSDGNGGTGSQLIFVTVTPVNEVPILNAAAFAIDENTPNGTTVGSMSASDADAGQSLTYSIIGGSGQTAFAIDPNTGVVRVADSSQLDYETTNSLSIVVQVADNGAPSLTDQQTVIISLNPLNDNTPVGTTENINVIEGASATMLDSGANSVLANDTDADIPADTLIAVLDSGPNFAASFTLNADGTFLYVHDGSENFTDSFTYHATDGVNNSTPVTVAIHIVAANDPPVAMGDTYLVNEDGTLVVVQANGVLANDADAEGDTLTSTLLSGPSHGMLTLAANGSFTYVPIANYFGSDSFTYRIDDGNGGSDIATVQLTVNSVNDTPQVGSAESYTVDNTGTLNAAAPGLIANDSDIDGDALTAVLVTGVAEGTLTLNADGSFTYQPPTSFNGVASFTYLVTDGVANSEEVTVTINVQAVAGTPPPAPPAEQPVETEETTTSETTTQTEESTETTEVEESETNQSEDTTETESNNALAAQTPGAAGQSQNETAANAAVREAKLGQQTEVESFLQLAERKRREAERIVNKLTIKLPPRVRRMVQTTFESTATQISAYVNPQVLFEKFEQFENEVKDNKNFQYKYAAGGVAVTTLALTTGYVFWTAKGGYLLASLISQMPAWRFMDPLPIYDSLSADKWSDENEEQPEK